MELERYCVIDVETTGLNPHTDRIVEIACALVDGTRVTEGWSTLINPGMPIPAEATAVNGITDRMVAGAPELGFALRHAQRLGQGRLVAAHCATFDLSFVGPLLGTQALCTMRLARAIFPEAPNHKNQTLRRFLGIDRFADERLAAHRALGDALVSAHVLIACRRRFRLCRPERSWTEFVTRNALVTSRYATELRPAV
ncbi:MAG TPA: 3'-5' exonuclease [Candidatus Cybelea sp.]|jgi:DNA polymerase III epsilon subunit-like protein